MTKIKILFVIGTLGVGGKERQLCELIKAINKDKYQIYLVLKAGSTENIERLKDHVEDFYFIKSGKIQPGILIDIRRVIHSIRPHIIHSWDETFSFLLILLLKLSGSSVPLIDGSLRLAYFKKGTINLYGLTRKSINYLADYLVANSKAGLKEFHAPKNKSSVIYNGFDFNRLRKLEDPSRLIKQLNIQSSFIVGMAARFHEHKDHKTFLDAAIKVLDQNVDITFILLGDGSLLKEMQNRVPNRFKESILFLGNKNDVESYMNICDIGVLTTNSDAHSEGIPNTIMEFMSLSKPVIVTDSGGVQELVHDGVNGFLISPKSSEELTKNIVKLLHDRNMMNIMGKNAKKRIENVFNILGMAESYDSLYKKIFYKNIQ